MAVTNYGVNANEAVKLWSRRLAREALKATYIQKFIGEGDDSVIQMRNDTKKGPGDRVRVTLRMQLTGDGIQGDSTLEGNEEALTTYTDDFVINQLRHAVRSAGKMSEQRIPFSIREEAMSGLRDWWSDRMDTWFFNQVCGYTVTTDTRYTGNNSVTAPSSNRKVFTVGSADETVQADSTKVMTLALIDKAVEAAKTATPLIRPININGGKHYVAFLHPYQVYDLRTSTSTGQWLDIQKAAMSGGKVGENPIFSGALGMYNNVILHESTRVTNGVHSSTGAAQTSTRRAVLCGAQSCVMGFGQGHSFKEFDWYEELFDYGNQLGVKAGCIGGLKKSVYNSTDFGTITMTSYAVAH
jgi:N4-gp56 family major capsid protein